MARVFSITAASSTITLDDKGHGEIAFTVANASGRPLRGRGILVPQDPSQKGWLTLAGEPERDFPAGGVLQFSVRVGAPAGSKPGNYTFRLDALSVQNPDEDYAQGATVAFTVREAKKKKPFPWWIVAVAAVVLVAGGITTWLLLRKPQPTSPQAPVTVPETKPQPTSNPTQAKADTLKSGQQLSPGQSIASQKGQFTFILQTDGNLVLYRGTTALWSTRTNGKPVHVAAMQGDGNLVLYDAQQHPMWASGTNGHPGAFLTVQDDGNVVIYTGTKAIWATNTVSSK
jgi:hypothetical protein